MEVIATLPELSEWTLPEYRSIREAEFKLNFCGYAEHRKRLD